MTSSFPFPFHSIDASADPNPPDPANTPPHPINACPISPQREGRGTLV
jgi:hypothetical protein